MNEPDPRRWWAFAALLLGTLTFALDATVLNVALPTLATSIDATTGQLQWIVASYVLVFGGLMLPMGVLGDRYGRKRLLVGGLALFAVASVAVILTTEPVQLIVARALMGLAASIMIPVTMAILPAIFPAEERRKALALTMMVLGAGMPLGPIVGGYLLRHFWWGSIFLINIPVAMTALVAVLLLLPESRDPNPNRPDLPGGLLSTAGLVSLVYGVVQAPTWGWTDRWVVASLLLGTLLVAAFLGWERVAPSPMVDLRLFARPRFLVGTIAVTTVTFCLMGLLFVLPQYLQSVRGQDAFHTGVRLLPLMAGLIVGAKLGETLSARIGAKTPTVVGMAIVACGLALGSLTGVETSYALVASWLVLVGLGLGWAITTGMELVMLELPEQRAGSGMGLTMTMRQVAGVAGVAMLGSLSSAEYSQRLHLPPGLSAEAAEGVTSSINSAVRVAARFGDPALLADSKLAYARAMSLVLLVCAGAALLCAGLVWWLLPARGSVKVDHGSAGESGHGSALAESGCSGCSGCSGGRSRPA